jgi:cytochrome c-type biogenesis protein CcmH/NrfG
MRNFERQADVFVYTLFDSAGPLIATFHKITAVSGQAPDKPNWHHFSISERVRFLRKCEQDHRWIGRHNRKVRRSLVAYVLGLLVMGLIGYQLNYGRTGAAISEHFLESIIAQEIADRPHDSGLFSMLGDIKYSQEAFAAAAQAYEKALQLDVLNVQVLNNLAWLYATCEDPRVRNPARALVLARQAAALEPQTAHILDTLAESQFVNGDLEAAINTARQALALADEPRDHYRQQLARFSDARQRP